MHRLVERRNYFFFVKARKVIKGHFSPHIKTSTNRYDINTFSWHIQVHENPLNWKDEHNSIQVSLIETLSPSSPINLYSRRDLNWPIQPQGIQVAFLLQQTDMSLEYRGDRGPNISYGGMSDYQVTPATEQREYEIISHQLQTSMPSAPLQLSADTLKNLAA